MIDCVYYNDFIRCYRNGVVERLYKTGWKILENKNNHIGYNEIRIKPDKVLRHRLIAYCFLGLKNIKSNLKHTDGVIDHKNHNRIDNRVDNLRIVSHRQNLENINCKGYYWSKGKWQAKIRTNNKEIYLGRFENENDAREAYLNAKRLYHII